jgi:predicted esterase
MAPRCVLLVAISGLLAVPSAQAATPRRSAAETCSCTPTPTFTIEPQGRVRATILVLHPGAWVWGSSELMRPTAQGLADRGYRAVAVGYPLRDLPAAYAKVEHVAQRYHGRAYALGESAGATMATWLQARHLVRGAVNLSGPINLRRAFPGDTRPTWQTSDTWRYSPQRILPRRVRVLAIAGQADPFTDLNALGSLRRRGANVRVVPGLGHETQPWELRAARRWLDRQTRRRR